MIHNVKTQIQTHKDNKDESKKTHMTAPGEEDPGGEVKEC